MLLCLCVCCAPDSHRGCVAKLSFSCPLKGHYCLYGKSCFSLCSCQPHLWIQIMLLSLQVTVGHVVCVKQDVWGCVSVFYLYFWGPDVLTYIMKYHGNQLRKFYMSSLDKKAYKSSKLYLLLFKSSDLQRFLWELCLRVEVRFENYHYPNLKTMEVYEMFSLI